MEPRVYWNWPVTIGALMASVKGNNELLASRFKAAAERLDQAVGKIEGHVDKEDVEDIKAAVTAFANRVGEFHIGVKIADVYDTFRRQIELLEVERITLDLMGAGIERLLLKRIESGTVGLKTNEIEDVAADARLMARAMVDEILTAAYRGYVAIPPKAFGKLSDEELLNNIDQKGGVW